MRFHRVRRWDSSSSRMRGRRWQMQTESSTLWEALSDRPDIGRLRHYVEMALAARGEEIEFIVLYGSMARGNWSIGSDFDLLIGLRIDDGKRFLDRVYEYEQLAPGR